MHLPRTGNTYAQERLGISAVQRYAALRQQIWRETGTGDVGIDGNLEYVNADGFATGRLMAVQVKAGPSYFMSRTAQGWKFYPEEKHRRYWEGFPIPVLLVLHDPVSGASYWSDARQALRTLPAEQSYIEVLSQNLLESTDAITLFENAGVQDKPFIGDINKVLSALLATKSRNACFPLSYFELFTHGLTNLCRSIYYGMDAIINAVEYNIDAAGSEFGMGMGDTEHQFAFGFVKFLIAQDLAQIDYADCLVDWLDREMQPHFVAPLTSRGRSLVALIHEQELALVTSGKLPDEGGLHVAQEGFFGMVPHSYMRRFDRIHNFQLMQA